MTGHTSSGYASLGPTMTADPTTSTINVTRGQTAANGVTVRLGSTGRLQAVWKGTAGSSAHLVLDVTGYFTD